MADKLATKFRAMAARLAAEIEAKRRDRRENTPRQQRDAVSAAIDADHLARVKIALEKLADARDAGTLPAALAGIKSKADILPMLRTRIDCSGGYYSMRDTGEFTDKSEAAVALREFVENNKGAAGLADDIVRSTKAAIETLERDLKFRPIPGFFPTPPELCAIVRERANLDRPFLRVLEPSAGKGDLAEAMWANAEGRPTHAAVHVCEVSRALIEVLKAKGKEIVGEDFLVMTPDAEAGGRYDRVVMNPPFENGQDIDHVRHAFRFLKPGGRLVAIMSAGPFFRNDRKATEFREWFEAVGGVREELSGDAFKNAFRSTGTKTCLVVIDAPPSPAEVAAGAA